MARLANAEHFAAQAAETHRLLNAQIAPVVGAFAIAMNMPSPLHTIGHNHIVVTDRQLAIDDAYLRLLFLSDAKAHADNVTFREDPGQAWFSYAKRAVDEHGLAQAKGVHLLGYDETGAIDAAMSAALDHQTAMNYRLSSDGRPASATFGSVYAQRVATGAVYLPEERLEF